jgi:hypothetical protein
VSAIVPRIGGSAYLLGDRGEGEVTGVLGAVRTTEVELSAASRELETEDRVGHGSIRNERLEERVRIVIRDALERHAHQSICGELRALEAA